ncbi:inner membrane-spanning protein YciB [Erythrobacter sp. HL-111]|uniref:inner membrane-spanning protein YciB n=1 Tax=Erythrobacter sp. HL-111 TaxID=1798193 RepID=UPI0006DBB5C8|nr:inner membrane-spanning protein YciB [Erythrobacter sp. HL-111]KPP96194.1 MAG: intracellular septation protein [Erythrobacteraceae bacterium HL-111]SDR78537.1 intracellular septation protein [Erythrobacter sp. HL-111]
MTEETKPRGSGWLNVAVDYGPLIVFLAVYCLTSPEEPGLGDILAIIYGTGAFMLAAVVALAVSKFLLGKVSPMLWFSTALIVGFGALTIWFQDEKFIQLKPTIIYSVFGVALIGGWLAGRALLRILLEADFEGLSEEGWLKLSRNWGVFFLFLAVLNELLVRSMDFGGWLWAKLWVFLPLTFLFTFANIPMLMKHGLSIDDADEVIKDEPPTGG